MNYKYINQLMIFAIALAIHTSSHAGFAGGPYAVWINISHNSEMDRIIGDQFDEMGRCTYPDAILFMRKRPKKITNVLAKKALIDGDKKSIMLLNSLLRKPYQDLNGGFDGIIVYTDSPSPRFIRLATGDPIAATRIIKRPTANNSIWEAFCVLMPQISRKP